MSDIERNQALFSLEREIQANYQSLNQNIRQMPDSEIPKDIYIEYQHRFSHLQNLFDRASELIKEISFEQSNPDFYQLLECKQSIRDTYNAFRALRNYFSRQFDKTTRTQNKDALEREREIEASPNDQEILEDESSEDLEASIDEADNALLAAMEQEALEEAEQEAAEKKEKREKERRRQEKFAREGRGAEERAQDELRARERLRHDDLTRASSEDTHAHLDGPAEQYYVEQQDYSQKSREQEGESTLHDNRYGETASYGNNAPLHKEQYHHENDTSNRQVFSPDSGVETRDYPPYDTRSNEISSSPAENAIVYHQETPDSPISQESTSSSSGKQQSAADRRNQEYREAESQEIKRIRDEQRTQRYHDTMSSYAERMEQTQDSIDVQKAHFDFSILHKGEPQRLDEAVDEPGRSIDDYYNIRHYRFVPGGVSETLIRNEVNPSSFGDVNERASSSNQEIYSAIKSLAAESDKPQTISSAFEAQMRYNLETARYNYQEKRDTPEAQQAARNYMEQRNAYAMLRNDLQAGHILLERPKVMRAPSEPDIPKEAKGAPTIDYRYTPNGVSGRAVQDAEVGRGQFEIHRNTSHDNFYYTPSRPMVVHPSYEAALKSRADQAAAVIDLAVTTSNYLGQNVRLNPVANDEVTQAASAYLGFQRAKQQGQVVLDDNSTRISPDPHIWSQRYLQDQHLQSQVINRGPLGDPYKYRSFEPYQTSGINSSNKKNPQTQFYGAIPNRNEIPVPSLNVNEVPRRQRYPIDSSTKDGLRREWAPVGETPREKWIRRKSMNTESPAENQHPQNTFLTSTLQESQQRQSSVSDPVSKEGRRRYHPRFDSMQNNRGKDSSSGPVPFQRPEQKAQQRNWYGSLLHEQAPKEDQRRFDPTPKDKGSDSSSVPVLFQRPRPKAQQRNWYNSLPDQGSKENRGRFDSTSKDKGGDSGSAQILFPRPRPRTQQHNWYDSLHEQVPKENQGRFDPTSKDKGKDSGTGPIPFPRPKPKAQQRNWYDSLLDPTPKDKGKDSGAGPIPFPRPKPKTQQRNWYEPFFDNKRRKSDDVSGGGGDGRRSVCPICGKNPCTCLKKETIGTTGQEKGFRRRKAAKKEESTSLLGRSNKLKRETIIRRYGKVMGYKIETWGTTAASRASRKFYNMMQNGDEDAPSSIRTFEQGRYYLVTTIGIANAVVNGHVVNSKGAQKAGLRAEKNRYTQFHFTDKKELSKHIHDSMKDNRLRKKEIRDMWKKGASLTSEERKELLVKMKEHVGSSREMTKAIAYRNLQRQNTNKVNAAKTLEQKRKLMTSPKLVEDEIRRLRKLEEQRMAKKFGKLMTVTDKSLYQKINVMIKEGHDLKEQIKLLQLKGSSLTAAERKTLLSLMKKHESLVKELRQYTGLRDARKNLNALLTPHTEMHRQIVKNRNAWSNGLYALYNLMLKPIREGSETGAQGLVKGADIATNRYVRMLVKKTWKFSMSSSKWLSGKTIKAVNATGRAFAQTVPGRTIKTASKTVREVSKTARKTKRTVKKGIETVKSVPGRAIKTASAATKKAAVRMTPRFIKTGASRTGAFLNATTKKARDYVAKSTVGRAISAVYRSGHKAMAALRTALSFTKGLLLKAGAAILGILLIFGLVSGIIEVAVSSVSTLVLAPYQAEEKINLKPYMDIYDALDEEFKAQITDLKTDPAYDEVIVNYLTNTMDNSREMLAMMAVRMSQNLSLESNDKVKPYLTSLFWDSHYYTTTTEDYECDGCKTRRVSGSHDSDCPDDCSSDHYYIERYCAGHTRLTINITILSFDELFTADSMGNADATATKGGLIGRAKITYYCAEKYPHICNAGPPYKTAMGTDPTPGRTIAVDRSKIELGTHVIIDGHEYVAEDTGGAVTGLHIDILVPRHSEALRKGTRYNVPVYNVSYEGEGIQESGEWNGWVEENIEWCKLIYEQNWAEIYTGIPNVTDIVGSETDISGVEFVDGDRPGNDAIVNVALSQLGNVGGQPYWSWYGFDHRDEWCAMFVSWCANQNGVLGSAVPKFAHCQYQGVPWFKEHGQWARPGDITPVAGDIIFFDWDSNGEANHVGIVVGTDGTNVYTVEGNSRDQVRTKSYPLNSNLILGYGLPNY